MQVVSDWATRLVGPRQTANGRTGALGILLDKPAASLIAGVVLLAPSVV